MRTFLKWLARRRKCVYRSRDRDSKVDLYKRHDGLFDLDVARFTRTDGPSGYWSTREVRGITGDDVDEAIELLFGKGTVVIY